MVHGDAIENAVVVGVAGNISFELLSPELMADSVKITGACARASNAAVAMTTRRRRNMVVPQ